MGAKVKVTCLLADVLLCSASEASVEKQQLKTSSFQSLRERHSHCWPMRGRERHAEHRRIDGAGPERKDGRTRIQEDRGGRLFGSLAWAWSPRASICPAVTDGTEAPADEDDVLSQ